MQAVQTAGKPGALSLLLYMNIQAVQRAGKPGTPLPLTLSQTIKKNLLPAQGNFNTGNLLSVYLYDSLKETLYRHLVRGFISVILF